MSTSPQKAAPLPEVSGSLVTGDKPSIAASSPHQRLIIGLPSRTAAVYLVALLVAFLAYAGPAVRRMASGIAPSQERYGGWAGAPILQKDSQLYLDVVHDIADGHLDNLHIRTFGYPLLLLATGSVEQPTRGLYFVSLLFHFVSIWLLAALLWAAGVKRSLLLFFGFLLLLPPMVEPAAFVMTENASQAMLVTGMAGTALGLVRRSTGWLIVGSLALAYAGLVHPLYQALSLFLSGCVILIRWTLPWARLSLRRAFSASAIILLGFFLLIGGAILNNRLTFHFNGLTPFTGFALSTKTVRVVEQLPDEYGAVREVLVAARDADLVKFGSSHTALSYIWRARDDVSRLTGLQGAELSQYLVKLNLLLIRRAPLAYLQDICLTAAGFWSPTSGQGISSMGSRSLQALWALLDLLLVITFFLTAAFMIGATALARVGRLDAGDHPSLQLPPKAVRARSIGYALALAVVFYTMTICALFAPGLTRYRAPVMPLLVFLVILGADAVWRLLRRPARASLRSDRLRVSASA